MRRKFDHHKKYGIIRSFVLFWKQCRKCKQEIRFEHMWRHTTGPFHGGDGRTYWACNVCFPTKKDVCVYIDQLMTRPDLRVPSQKSTRPPSRKPDKTIIAPPFEIATESFPPTKIQKESNNG